MKIAVFSEFYEPHRGGVEVRAAGMCGALVDLGHEVTVHTVGYDPALSPTETINGVHVVRYPASRYDRPVLAATRRSVWSTLRFALWCRARAKAPYDLYMYEEFPWLHGFLAPRSARMRGVFDWCEYRAHPVFAVVQRMLPRMFRSNVAVSDAVATRISASSGRVVSTLPSGIRTSSFRNRPRAQRTGIIYVGRLWRHKNFPLTVASFEELCRRGYPGTLTIVGDGPEADHLRQLVAASPVADRIVMTGSIDEAAKVEILSRAELLFLLSGREGFPVVVAEAMASGLPTVTVDLPDNGAKSVVAQYGAGAVAVPTAVAVADAAQAVLADWEANSQRCLQAAAQLDWRELVTTLLTRNPTG